VRASLRGERVLNRDAIVEAIVRDRGWNRARGVKLAGRNTEGAGERRQGSKGEQDEGEDKGCATV
jgi:hypothetical protein